MKLLIDVYLKLSRNLGGNFEIRVATFWYSSGQLFSTIGTGLDLYTDLKFEWSIVRAKDSFVYTISGDMIGLDKTKTNWRGRERIGTILFLANFSYAVMRRGLQNRIDNKVQDRYHWLIYFYVENLIFDRHFISVLSPRMCCTYTDLLCTHFCHLIRSVSGEMSLGHLVEGSDDWKYIYTSVSWEISTWMLKKIFFVLEFDFCRSTSAFKCEAHILRFTVIFFVFLKQNRTPFHKNDSTCVFNRLKKSSQLDLNSWLLAHISADAVQTALTRHSVLSSDLGPKGHTSQRQKRGACPSFWNWTLTSYFMTRLSMARTDGQNAYFPANDRNFTLFLENSF